VLFSVMVVNLLAALWVVSLHTAFASSNATCANNRDCSDASASLLQVGEGRGWRCGREHQDPYGGGRSGRCCRGLTKVQGKFTSNRCTYKCFACTGRGYHKDPYGQCGGECSQWDCKVPCCPGTHEIKGRWNSGSCTYQCMCAGYGEDTYQYCAGGNPCGGHCHVPCCYPLHEVFEHGRKICRSQGEIRGRLARGEIKESDVSSLVESAQISDYHGEITTEADVQEGEVQGEDLADTENAPEAG